MSAASNIGSVYFIREIEPGSSSLTGYVKIGRAKNVLGRVKALQVSTPRTLMVYQTINCASYKIMERLIHALFDNKRIRGEWFYFDNEVESFLKDINGLMPTEIVTHIHALAQGLSGADDPGYAPPIVEVNGMEAEKC